MSEQEVLKYAEELISKNKFAIVGTISNEKYPNTRALRVMQRDGIKTFYFSTKKKSLKVAQIKKNNKGCIFFYDVEKYVSIMFEGKFEVRDNTLFEISSFYELDPNPYDFCNLVFKAETLHLYIPYNKYIMKI